MKKILLLVFFSTLFLFLKSSIAITSQEAPAGKKPIQIVAVPVEKLKALSRKVIDKEIHKNRALADLNKEFKISNNFVLGGVGAFKTKVLTPEEISQDPVLFKVYKSQNPNEAPNLFVKTKSTIQLFASTTLPIEIAESPLAIIPGARLKGMVEIMDTRIIPKDLDAAAQKFRKRVFRWPITIENLENELKVGESLSVTGFIEDEVGITTRFGESLGSFVYSEFGTNAKLNYNRSKDIWMSIHFKKINASEVRIVLQKGEGKVTEKAVSIQAGFKVYDDYLLDIENNNLENSFIGVAVAEGKVALIHSLETALNSEISYSSTIGNHNKYVEGWGAVSLTKKEHVSAINQLFRFNAEPLRALPAREMNSPYLNSGRLKVYIKDVTNDKRITAKISLFQVKKKIDVHFYEIKWNFGDFENEHYLVGIAADQTMGAVTKFNRFEQTSMWHDLNRDASNVVVTLGPEKRIFTTQWEDVREVVALQNALNLSVEDPYISEPKLYIDFLCFGNFGKSEEKGYFHLTPTGIENISRAGFNKLLTAYLKADWRLENVTIPNSLLKNEKVKAYPPWSEEAPEEKLQAVLSFFNDYSMEISKLFPGRVSDVRKRGRLRNFRTTYSKMTDGRNVVSDNNRYKSAFAFANYIKEMQDQGDNPTKLIELFLKLRQHRQIDLKRACLASGIIAGQGKAQNEDSTASYTGYIEMKGSRISLIPDSEMDGIPSTPLYYIEDVISRWVQ